MNDPTTTVFYTLRSPVLAIALERMSVNSVVCMHTLQIRRKADDENLAEWIVDITTEADRQGSDRFTTAYQTCARPPLRMPDHVRAWLCRYLCSLPILRSLPHLDICSACKAAGAVHMLVKPRFAHSHHLGKITSKQGPAVLRITQSACTGAWA